MRRRRTRVFEGRFGSRPARRAQLAMVVVMLVSCVVAAVAWADDPPAADKATEPINASDVKLSDAERALQDAELNAIAAPPRTDDIEKLELSTVQERIDDYKPLLDRLRADILTFSRALEYVHRVSVWLEQTKSATLELSQPCQTVERMFIALPDDQPIGRDSPFMRLLGACVYPIYESVPPKVTEDQEVAKALDSLGMTTPSWFDSSLGDSMFAIQQELAGGSKSKAQLATPLGKLMEEVKSQPQRQKMALDRALAQTTAAAALAKYRLSKAQARLSEYQNRFDELKGRLEDMTKESILGLNQVVYMMFLLAGMFLVTVGARYLIARLPKGGSPLHIISDRTLVEFGGMSFILLTIVLLGSTGKLEPQALAALLGTVSGYIFGKSRDGESPIPNGGNNGTDADAKVAQEPSGEPAPPGELSPLGERAPAGELSPPSEPVPPGEAAAPA